MGRLDGPVFTEFEDDLRPNETVVDWLFRGLFAKDCLDRRLKRHHITGIAFSGAVGIGLFQSSGEIIVLGGPVGALLAYIFAGLVVFSVMRSLAEMASVQPVRGALMDYPHTFVDEALRFAVGVMYWVANCMSTVVLTSAATMCTQYWGSGFSVGSATFVLLLGIALMNACGVRLYGNLEWAFKWLKILLIVGLGIVMIAILAGAGTGKVVRNYSIAPGWSPIGYNQTDPVNNPTYQTGPAIPGVGGKILSVWTCTTLAMIQFVGGEIVLVTAGEAESPRKDLPKAAQYMYLLPVGFYIVSILLVGLNVNYLEPIFYHPHMTQGYLTAAQSPFVVAIMHAGIKTLPGFLNACFLFSAITAANSGLYVSSRTLFELARNSNSPRIKNTIGRTNNGNTPLTAILISFLPGLLSFLMVRYQGATFSELIHVFGRLYTGSVFCVYGSECLAFLRFKAGMKIFRSLIERDAPEYRKDHYRGTWQPLWAIIGLVSCTLLMLFSGWSAIYNLCAKPEGVPTRDSIVDLIAVYLGVSGSPRMLSKLD
ncbi:Cationic amino acid transporter 2 [Lobaria immixta]|nr:Cationic amino acid transporter 2 [Lobaria immixta]